MEEYKTSERTIKINKISENIDYFKYIFKKSEKIVCAVFFITRSSTHDVKDDLISDIENAARQLQEVVLQSLEGDERTLTYYAHMVRIALINLESRLRIGAAAKVLSLEHVQVFLTELEVTQRSLRRFRDTGEITIAEESIQERRPQMTRNSYPRVSTQTDTSTQVSPQRDRSDRVLEIIRTKRVVTIKDIVHEVKDCSEKTIQRVLLSLIEKGLISKEGERRWSKYSVV